MMQHLKVQPGRVLPSSAVEPHGTSGSAEIGRSRRPTRKLPWVGVGRQGVNVLSFFKLRVWGEQRQGFGVYMHESRLAARSVMLGGRVGPQTRLLRQYVVL